LMSFSVTFVPFFTTSVLGTHTFVPSYSMFTTVMLIAFAGSAARAWTRRPRPRAPASAVRVRMRVVRVMRRLLQAGVWALEPQRAPDCNVERAAAPGIIPPRASRGTVHAARRLRPAGRPAAGHRRADRRRRGVLAAAGAARRDGQRQDVHGGARHREPEPARTRHRPQQDARSAALPRVPHPISGQRGPVLRQLLRLLPA